MRFQRLMVEVKLPTHRVRAARKVANGVPFAANPVGLIGLRAYSGARKEKLPSEFDLGRSSGVAREQRIAQAVAQLPCSVRREVGEVQERFLLREDREVLGWIRCGVHAV